MLQPNGAAIRDNSVPITGSKHIDIQCVLTLILLFKISWRAVFKGALYSFGSKDTSIVIHAYERLHKINIYSIQDIKFRKQV